MLEIQNLSISFRQYHALLQQQLTPVLRDVSFQVRAGEIVAVIGASGAGKSLLAHAIMGLLPHNAHVTGTINYAHTPLDEARLKQLRGKQIRLIPQSVNYLDPLMKIGALMRSTAKDGAALQELRSMMLRFGLPSTIEQLYPHELSGGMARRVLVAMAASGGAKLVIADEPTPGMEAGHVLETLHQLKAFADQGCAVLLITHEIGAALQIADSVIVLKDGEVVEQAAAADFTGDGERLRHAYSRALWRALPQNAFVV